MYINFETSDGGNENSPSSTTKEVKYHYPDEITVFTRSFSSMLSSDVGHIGVFLD